MRYENPGSFHFFVAAQLSWANFTSSAHPGSGIVVDAQGNVYFTYIEHGVGKIDPQGKLTYIGRTRGGHWMCLDPQGSFSRTQPRHFERITPDGVKPVLIYAGGGSPIALLRDGNLYYVSNDESMTPGGMQVTRQSPLGVLSIFPPDGKKTTDNSALPDWLKDRTVLSTQPIRIAQIQPSATPQKYFYIFHLRTAFVHLRTGKVRLYRVTGALCTRRWVMIVWCVKSVSKRTS